MKIWNTKLSDRPKTRNHPNKPQRKQIHQKSGKTTG